MGGGGGGGIHLKTWIFQALTFHGSHFVFGDRELALHTGRTEKGRKAQPAADSNLIVNNFHGAVQSCGIKWDNVHGVELGGRYQFYLSDLEHGVRMFLDTGWFRSEQLF